jgi:hypothetical protein
MVFVPAITSIDEQVKIIQYLENKTIPCFKHKPEKSRFIKKCSNFTYKEGNLYFQKGPILLKVVCIQDTVKISEILTRLHGKNHHGEKKMRFLVKQEYCGIKRSVLRDFLSNCEVCKHYQPLKTTDVVKNITASKSFQRLQIDLVDMKRFSEENDGFNWMCNVIDVFTKYLFSFKLKQKSAEEVSNFYLFSNI